ncbi:hypothetical protein FACS1894172_11400 [Spirochaetia bacterium]|nr:hypothetical protein FACS1894164_14760 [Spirochaetia bacterium]GHU33248.1 hypothetical protein FACS1894172_11400 [Spirochaetia bacterium]
MTTIIRSAEEPDIPYLYDICIRTGDKGNDASSLFYDPHLLGHYYAAPYFFYDRSVCFVVAEDGIPKGYIVAATDTVIFRRWLNEMWLPPLREHYTGYFPAEKVRSPLEQSIITLIHAPPRADPAWIHSFPAHLHIDLLPDVQHRGYGRALMEKLIAALCRRGIPGIHLGVDVENRGARIFYQKTGFMQLEEREWGFTLGKNLNPD